MFRVYTDTSVFGGVFDTEFSHPSTLFFNQVRAKRFQLVISPVVQDEIQLAPDDVRSLFDNLFPLTEFVEISEQALLLRQAYLQTGIVTPKSAADALHVALATIACCLSHDCKVQFYCELEF